MTPFTAPTRHWFTRAFAGPTPVQEQGWQRIADGSHTLLIAPTGSGKTLAAFGRLDYDAEPGVRVLYVSPLKALVYDIERNLRTPLVGIERAAAQLGEHYRHPRVDIRTGDTPQSDRRRQVRDPGEIMVTTPGRCFCCWGRRRGRRSGRCGG